MKRFLISMFLLLQGTLSHADVCPKIIGNTIIFGGRGSTKVEMAQCYPQFLALSHDEDSRLVSCLAQQINDSGGQKFVIAGHSSGAVEAENVVRLVTDKSKVRLVLLEGFAYQANQRGNVETTCWFAQNSDKGIRGFNAPSMLNPAVCPQPARASEAGWCNTDMCLHLANVNLNVPGDLSGKTVLTQGLANCRGNNEWVQENLSWLNE